MNRQQSRAAARQQPHRPALSPQPCPWPLSIGGQHEPVPEGAMHIAYRNPGADPNDLSGWPEPTGRRLRALRTPDRPGEATFEMDQAPLSAPEVTRVGRWRAREVLSSQPDFTQVPLAWELGCLPGGREGPASRDFEMVGSLAASALKAGVPVHHQCSMGVTRSVSFAAATLAYLTEPGPGSWQTILSQLAFIRPEAVSHGRFELCESLQRLADVLGHDTSGSPVHWL